MLYSFRAKQAAVFPFPLFLKNCPYIGVVPLRFPAEWGIWELKGALALPKICK